MKKILRLSLITVIVIFSSHRLIAQQADQKQQEEAVKALINAQQYTFVAQRAVPLSMPPRQLLNAVYLLKVSKDTVEAYLPYYGKTNAMPASVLDDGFSFKAGDFKYTLQERKKGGWNIKIALKDAKDVTELHLTITPSGYATLQVTSTDKEFISYNGYVQ
ncbi:MAG TPA: DUF4251 domain-containing protein [Puia sp.]|nr:DUF4251 domain-containing protein [Puia sp.]